MTATQIRHEQEIAGYDEEQNRDKVIYPIRRPRFWLLPLDVSEIGQKREPKPELGPSLHVRKKCSVSACRYRKQQISIFTVWKGSGHVVLFSEPWSKPDDPTEPLWCHWALFPQVTVGRNSFSEGSGNPAAWQRGEHRADQMDGQEWKILRKHHWDFLCVIASFKWSLTPGMQTPSFSAYIISAAKIANQKFIFAIKKLPKGRLC